MSVLITLLILVALAALVVFALVCLDAAREQQARRLRNDLRATDRAIEREQAAARRAMNRAAGQGWRNPFE